MDCAGVYPCRAGPVSGRVTAGIYTVCQTRFLSLASLKFSIEHRHQDVIFPASINPKLVFPNGFDRHTDFLEKPDRGGIRPDDPRADLVQVQNVKTVAQ